MKRKTKNVLSMSVVYEDRPTQEQIELAKFVLSLTENGNGVLRRDAETILSLAMRPRPTIRCGTDAPNHTES